MTESVVKTEILENFLEQLNRILEQNDRDALYDKMDPAFRQRVNRQYFLRLDKYVPGLGENLRLVKIYQQSDSLESFMVRISFDKQDGTADFANMFLSEHNGDIYIVSFFDQRN